MKKSLSIYCAFIAIAMTGGCTLETLDTYDGPQCENVEKIITIIDYGRPNGIYNEVSCLSHVTDVNTNRVICDEYVSYDHVNGVSIAQTEPQMIYALSIVAPMGIQYTNDGSGDTVSTIQCIKAVS